MSECSPKFYGKPLAIDYSQTGVAVAYLELDPLSQHYRVRFRYAGKQYKRSLRTTDSREARGLKGRVEETILLLERGRLEMPEGADPATFILSDGKLAKKQTTSAVNTIGELFRLYDERLPEGVKEPTTRATEITHQAHLLKHLKTRTVLKTLTPADMQDFASKRLQDKWRKKRIGPETVKKELATFRMIWNWAVNQEIIEGRAPVRGIQFPKQDEKPPFMTLADAERILKQGSFSKQQEKEICDSIFLTRDDIQDLLTHIRAKAGHPFLYPLFAFVAHTGARRSEILNARLEDFDFAAGTVSIREKKKSRKLGTTYRRVDLTPLLSEAIQDWRKNHPGGPFVITNPNRLGSHATAVFKPMNPNAAQKHFRRAVAKTRWAKLRGFHVFRHSFASNLASLGVDQRIIDDFLGHTTEEMRRRYRHLIPATKKAAIALLMPEPMLKVITA